MKPKVKIEKYRADVCFGGVYALFPDNTIRHFRDQPEALEAIKKNAKARTGRKQIHAAIIEWEYRDRKVRQKL